MQKRRKRIIFAIAYLAYTSIYIVRVNLSMAGPELIKAGIVDTVQLGALGSVFSTVYAIGRLINGGLSDRTSPWKMPTTGLALAGVGNLSISFFPPFAGLFLLQTLNAYAKSVLWSSVLCVVSRLYEKREAKKRTSIMVTSVAMGNILGILINTALITYLGTAFAFAVPGILTLVLGALVLIFTKNIEMEEPATEKHRSMFELLRVREMRIMCLPALFHGVLKENTSLWMTVFIVDTYSVDMSIMSC